MEHDRRSDDYRRIDRAILFLEENADHQPELSEVAEHLYLSESHVQRLFSRWVGISPSGSLGVLKGEACRGGARGSTLDAVAIDTLRKAGLKVGRAWAIKEAVRKLWDYRSVTWARPIIFNST